MADRKKEIQDDEFRVIGKTTSDPRKDKKKSSLIGVVSLVLVALIGLLAYLKWPKEQPHDPENGVFDPAPVTALMPTAPLCHPTDSTFTEVIDTTINDVPLTLYFPHNSIPELSLGVPSRENTLLAAQAADVRADNKKILGAFVLKGQPLAWGLSKKGFCAIIDGQVTVGVSDNSPLFEEATEKGGFFFRQYPLIDNGVLIENEPKNKTARRALCSRAGELFVTVSRADESFHDFTQALVDLGVENAIYLVGGHSAGGWYRDADGNRQNLSPGGTYGTYKNETYIVWRY